MIINIRGKHNFSVKGHYINDLEFADHSVPVETIQLSIFVIQMLLWALCEWKGSGMSNKTFFFFVILCYIIIIIFTLQYCIGFAIHWHGSDMGLHVFPILKTPPISLPIPSIWVIPVQQPQAPCISHWTWTGNSFHI